MYTFLFTDIVGSTRRWSENAAVMASELEDHDSVLRRAVTEAGGRTVKHTGDGLAAVFDEVADAVSAAVVAQRLLRLPVRMGIHTGAAQSRAGDFFGPAVNRAARIADAGNGGQILLSGDAAQSVSSSVGLLDLGSHRLKDLEDPEHLWQVVAGGLKGEFGPLRTMEVLPTNLPSQATPFIGRRTELEHLAELIARNRLVTVTGTGGIGKTRLALQAAARGSAEFSSGGVWFVDIGLCNDGDQILSVVCRSIGLPLEEPAALRGRLMATMRLGRNLLLLDNCEHVADELAPLVYDLVSSLPSLNVVTTSRQRLGVPGEQVFPLGPISSSEEAIDFVVEKARRHRPRYEPDDRERSLLDVLCRRLDKLPLALELAAARLRSMDTTGIIERLDDRFRLLTSRDAAGGEQSLLATIEWSHALLEPAEQLLFENIAIFPDGADLQAILHVATPGLDEFDLVDQLESLVDKSMLVVAEDDVGVARYRLLETLRQFALARLDGRDASADLSRRHADYVTAVLRAGLSADQLLRWSSDIRTATETLLAVGVAGTAIELALLALHQSDLSWWEPAGWFDEQTLDDPSVDADLRAEHQALAAVLLLLQGDAERSLIAAGRCSLLRSGRPPTQSSPDDPKWRQGPRGGLEYHNGLVAAWLGDTDEALRCFELVAQHGGIDRAMALSAIATLYMSQDRVADAVAAANQAAASEAASGIFKAVALVELGRANAHAEGSGRREFDEALAIARQYKGGGQVVRMAFYILQAELVTDAEDECLIALSRDLLDLTEYGSDNRHHRGLIEAISTVVGRNGDAQACLMLDEFAGGAASSTASTLEQTAHDAAVALSEAAADEMNMARTFRARGSQLDMDSARDLARERLERLQLR